MAENTPTGRSINFSALAEAVKHLFTDMVNPATCQEVSAFTDAVQAASQQAAHLFEYLYTTLSDDIADIAISLNTSSRGITPPAYITAAKVYFDSLPIVPEEEDD
jgi:hypothetical protein